MKVPGKPRRIELDFVRGIAIFMVMSVHFRVPHTGVALLDGAKTSALYVGGHGVTLFFVLSGFLVGGLLMKEYKATQELKAGRFLLRRMFKIWPSYYFLLVFHAVIRRHPFHSFFWQNFFHVQNYYGSTIQQTWSLAVEEHFYLVMPVLMYFIAKRKWGPEKMLITFGSVAALAFTLRWMATRRADYDAIHHYTQFNVDSMLCGVCIAVLFYYMPEVYAKVSKRAWPLALVTVAAMAGTLLPHNNWTNPLDNTTSYLGCAAFLMLVMEHSGWMARTWVYRGISTVGIYSYGIYLYHSLMLTVGERISARYTGPMGWFAAVIVQTTGGIIIGVIMSRIVEWPFLMWRERIGSLKDSKPLLPNANEGDVDPIVELEPVSTASV